MARIKDWLVPPIDSSASVFEPRSCGHRVACEDVVDVEVALKSNFVFGNEGLRRGSGETRTSARARHSLW